MDEREAPERTLDATEIQRIIPHRFPFLFVDRVTDLDPGRRAVGWKNVSIGEPFFQGHFPSYPVMPGVLIVEALAQVGAVALLATDEFRGKLALFAGIEKVRFKRQVRPGDVLRLDVELGQVRRTIGEPFFQGHFPSYPVMPGVLIVEALAQVGAVALLATDEFRGKLALFAGIEKVRFKRQVRPGDVLRLDVELGQVRRTIGSGTGTATVDGEVACRGELLFALVDAPDDLTPTP